MEANARIAMVQALIALDNWRDAYQLAQSVRERFATSAADVAARTLAYAILAAHPQAADTASIDYRKDEAALLLREGQPALALAMVRGALALRVPAPVRAELTWLEAEASRADAAAANAALLAYLALAPAGSHAPAALNALAHLRWHAADTAAARVYFNRIVRDFPGSELAPNAMFEIGRTYEDDSDLKSARAQYLRLAARYPYSEAAADARFRAPFMLYMLGRFYDASAEFAEAGRHADDAAARDMFAYWNARALERNGEGDEARAILRRLAVGIESNYYPALAAMRVNLRPEAFPPQWRRRLRRPRRRPTLRTPMRSFICNA